MTLFDVSAIFVIAFSALSLVDGLYFHLYLFRLHARPESRREHWAHTGRALLFIPTLLLVLSGTSSGGLLWLGVVLLLADVGVTIVDLVLERTARDFQGGLPAYEQKLHVVLSVLHLGAIGTSLLARPAAAWLGTTSEHLEAAAFTHDVAMVGLFAGALVVAAAHLALMVPAVARLFRLEAPAVGADVRACVLQRRGRGALSGGCAAR